MKVPVYTQEGKKGTAVDVSDKVFDASWNADLVHQVVVGMQANARSAIAHTKDRSDVRGGGKKPWKQKGTGRARHGSNRSPIWRGGGVTFGPRNDRNFAKKINKKMRAQALFMTLSRKYTEGTVLFLDALTFEVPKTTEAKKVLTTLTAIKGFQYLTTKKHNTAYIALPEVDTNVQKSFRNFANIKVGEVRNLNPVETLRYKYIIIVAPEVSVQELEARLVVTRDTNKTT